MANPKLNYRTKNRIQQIEDHYNPDHDMIDGAVQVTWVDYSLLQLIEVLIDEVIELKREVHQLKNGRELTYDEMDVDLI